MADRPGSIRNESAQDACFSALRMWKEDRARGDRMPAFLLCMMHLRAGRRKRSCPLHGARLLCPDSV